MNFGIQDAQNLVWKLATPNHLDPALAEQLLDSYQAERLPVTTTMVNQVRRLTTLVTKSGRLGRRIFGSVGPRIMHHTALKNVLGPPLAGLNIAYRHGALIFADDQTSGSRAAPASQHLPAGAWSWRSTEQQLQLVLPDAVVAASGPSIADIKQRIARSPLLAALADISGPGKISPDQLD